MKVLVVYTNRMRMLSPAPLGASLVASRLRRDGHDVRLLDLMFAKSATKTAAEAARAFRPDLIGVSLRNRDNQSAAAYRDTLPGDRAIVAALRDAAPGATFLLGGTAFTTHANGYMREVEADYGYRGDDLGPISRFVASLAAGAPDLDTPGLVYRAGQGAIRANPFAIAGYSATQFDNWDLIDYRPYRRAFFSLFDAAVLTRTGCPFGCVFCDTFLTFGCEWRLRDPAAIVEDIVTLRRMHGVRSVWLADAGFNRPLDHAKAVLEALIRAGVRVGLESVFEPGEGDAEFASLYRRAGGREAMFFAGSLSDTVLEAQARPFTLADVCKGVEEFGKAGVGVSMSYIVGGPGETPDTLEETLTRSRGIDALFHMAERGLRIQNGTPLYDIALREGMIGEGFDCFHTAFYQSPQTPVALLDEYVRAFNVSANRMKRSSLPWLSGYLTDKAAAWLQ